MIPAIAYASGDRILLSFYAIIIETIILFVIVILLKLNIWRKLILILVYFITDTIILTATAHEPYFDNATKIDLDLCLIPALAVTVTYIIIQTLLPKK